jgi:hypothetical protein
LKFLKVCDYTLSFLLKVFNSPSNYLDWNNDVFRWRDRRNSLLEHWLFLLLRLQSFLTPFDVLSFFAGDIESNGMKGKISRYLDKFIRADHVCECARHVTNPEYDVSGYLSEANSGAWEDYRIHHWRSAVRGRVFSYDFDLSDYSMPSNRSCRAWWKNPKHVQHRPVHASIAISMPGFWFAPIDDKEGSFSSTYESFHILEERLSIFSI